MVHIVDRGMIDDKKLFANSTTNTTNGDDEDEIGEDGIDDDGGSTTSSKTTKSSDIQMMIATALVTLLYEAMMGHILEFLKIAMQTAKEQEPGSTTYSSIIHNITSEKGIGGLWDGFIPWGVIQSVFKGGVVS